MPLTRETLSVVTHLTSTLVTFRCIQLAHAACRLTGTQQMTVRRRFRHCVNISRECSEDINHELPNGRWDGVRYSRDTRCRAFGEYTYWSDGIKYGASIEWPGARRIHITLGRRNNGVYTSYINDVLHERCEYVNGFRQGEHLKYNERGQLIQRHTYVNGARQGVFMEWDDDGELLEHIVVRSVAKSPFADQAGA